MPEPIAFARKFSTREEMAQFRKRFHNSTRWATWGLDGLTLIVYLQEHHRPSYGGWLKPRFILPNKIAKYPYGIWF